ncbi:hypothetical protein ACWEKT_33085 [Nocardia takedensis]
MAVVIGLNGLWCGARRGGLSDKPFGPLIATAAAGSRPRWAVENPVHAMAMLYAQEMPREDQAVMPWVITGLRSVPAGLFGRRVRQRRVVVDRGEYRGWFIELGGQDWTLHQLLLGDRGAVVRVPALYADGQSFEIDEARGEDDILMETLNRDAESVPCRDEEVARSIAKDMWMRLTPALNFAD